MRKVKYTRKEYREEYLQSEEWKKLRNLIMDSKPSCQCKGCKNDACDPHHMVYRDIVDVKVSDILPVCRGCHNLIHEAIKNNYIPKEESQKTSLLKIKEKTINITEDKKYQRYKKWLNSNHFLDEETVSKIKEYQQIVLKQVGGLKRRYIQDIKELKRIEFSGKQIEKVRKLIQSVVYRKANHLLNKKRKRSGFFTYGRNGLNNRRNNPLF